jgi:hypothetical protein
MFGLFKKKDSDKSTARVAIHREFDVTPAVASGNVGNFTVEAANRREFDLIVALALVAPLSKQARVGKGINDALSTFDQKYTKKSFQKLTFPEKMVFCDAIAKRQEELRLKDGDVSIEHLGYSLVARWLLAVTICDDELVKHFEGSMQSFKRAAQSL